MKQIQTQWHSVQTSDASQMRLFVARPDSKESAPCVIIFQEAFGLNAHIRDISARVAALGFLAVAPELFHRTAPGFEGDYNDLEKSKPHMEALTNDRLETDIQATHSCLQSDAQADGSNLAALGFCLGGKAAFIAGAVLPLKATISYYGSSIPSLLSEYTAAQHAPLLLVWGGKDTHINAQKRIEVAERLRAENKAFTQVEFSDAGHGFFCDVRKTYHADAAHESWAMLAVFLKNKLHK